MKKLCIVLLLITLPCLSAQAMDARITIKSLEPNSGKITPLLFGNFLEFLNDFINGDYGLWAQEIKNRGFDIKKSPDGLPLFWYKYSSHSTLQDSIQLIEGGYNTNGRLFQRLNKKSSLGELGICQNVYVSDTVGNEFYCYLKSSGIIHNVRFSLSDTASGVIYFSKEISGINDRWSKFVINTPPIAKTHTTRLMISLPETGCLDIDEASFMPLNNVYGIKQEYFSLFSQWKPGIIRYPGGGFADYEGCHFQYGIGDIDQRVSSDFYWGNYQRMDFGTDEYYQFCRKAGIGFQIIVNFGTGTPEEAADWVEYCNGDTNTHYGKLRASYGFPEPFNVKYWEIGNEQYGEWAIGKLKPPDMAKRFLLFYKAMKEVDSTIQIIIDGSLWGGKEYFDTVMDIVGDSCDIYGWHLDQSYDPIKVNNDTASFLSMMGNSKNAENWLLNFEQWLKEDNYFPKIRQGITEWYTAYTNYNWWSHERTFSMETALWTALHLNMFMRHANSFMFSERSCLGAIFVKGFDSKSGKRIIAPSPTYHVLNLMRNHSGTTYLETNVDCDTYNTPDVDGIWAARDVKWIDATTTRTKDSLFISIVNRNPGRYINTHLAFDSIEIGDRVQVYQLAGRNMLDSNYADNPEAVKPDCFDTLRSEAYLLPPHSLTILAFSLLKPASIDASVHDFKFYPNPVLNNLFVEIPDSLSGNVEISIYDIIGNIVYSASLQSSVGDFNVNLENLAPGTYFIKYVNNNIFRFNKFVKLKES